MSKIPQIINNLKLYFEINSEYTSLFEKYKQGSIIDINNFLKLQIAEFFRLITQIKDKIDNPVDNQFYSLIAQFPDIKNLITELNNYTKFLNNTDMINDQKMYNFDLINKQDILNAFNANSFKIEQYDTFNEAFIEYKEKDHELSKLFPFFKDNEKQKPINIDLIHKQCLNHLITIKSIETQSGGADNSKYKQKYLKYKKKYLELIQLLHL